MAEFSLLDYARYHQLSADHLQLRPLSPSNRSALTQTTIPDQYHLTELTFLRSPIPTEKLTAARESTTFLLEARKLEKIDLSHLLQPHRFSNLHVEEVLLPSTPKSDIWDFGFRPQPDLQSLNFPFEVVDEEQNEGLRFPSSYRDVWKKFEDAVAREKLEMGVDDLLVFQRTVRCELSEDEERDILEAALSQTSKRRLVSPITPPLLPLPQPPLSISPHKEISGLSLFSEIVSPEQKDLEDLERTFFEDGSLIPDTPPQQLTNTDGTQCPDLISSFLVATSSPTIPTPPPRILGIDLKIETPLTALATYATDAPQQRKSVTFAEMVRTQMEPISRSLSRNGALSGGGTGSSPSTQTEIEMEMADFFASIEPLAQKVELELNQEPLQAADSTQRVAVPLVTSFLPHFPPWKLPEGNRRGTLTRLLSRIKDDVRDLGWAGTRAIEARLGWIPFPLALGRLGNQDEELILEEETSIIEEFLELEREGRAINMVMNSESQTWKKEGLRVLDDIYEGWENGEIEELERGGFVVLPGNDTSMSTLVRKRKADLVESGVSPLTLEMKEGEIQNRNENSGNASTKRSKAKPFSKITLTEAVQSRLKHLKANTSHFQDFSAASSIANFMEVRGKALPDRAANPKPTQNWNNEAVDYTRLQRPKLPLDQRAQEISTNKYVTLLQPPRKLNPISFDRYNFILACSIFTSRKLYRTIKEQLPAAKFIVRDLSSEGAAVRSIGQQAANGRHHAETSDEADIITSPSTGLVWTTLQKVSQRPLPGSKFNSLIRDRVLKLARRYERLVVIISEAREADDYGETTPTTIGRAAMHSLEDFNRFCTELCSGVVIELIPGGENELYQRIAKAMVAFSCENDLNLLEEETTWEVFLRRLGFNPFASQAILNELKNLGDVNGDCGLRRFVNMSHHERRIRLSQVLGGTRILDTATTRLNSGLDVIPNLDVETVWIGM